MVRNNKGVTLTSLSIYIVVSVIVLASLAFLNINFMSQIAELSMKSEKTNELLKVQTYLINDIKAANKVLEFSDKYLKFDNGVEYKIKYRANRNEGENQTYDVYELYRGDVLVTEKMANIAFEYDYKYNEDEQKNEEWIVLKILDEGLSGGDIFIKVGKGY